MISRLDLLPAAHRPERILLLDLLAGREIRGSFGEEFDAAAFLEITPPPLYPFLHHRMAKIADRLNVPPPMRSLLEQRYRYNAMLHLRRMADLRRIGAALSAAGIDYLVLKGPVLAATVYDDPATRSMLDLDLLVHDIEPAMSVLATLGYIVPETFAGKVMNAGDAPPLWNGVPGSAVVELHTLLDSAPDDPAALARAWASARRVDLGHGVVVPTLNAEEFLALVILHLSRHHRFEGELRSLLDLALLLRSAETRALDWSALADEWQRRSIGSWIGLSIALAGILLGSEVLEAVRRFAVPEEALTLAAEQLWVRKDRRVLGRVTQLFTRERPAALHRDTPATAVPMPAGINGMWLRARRPWQSARNLVASWKKGLLRPRNVAQSVAMLHKQERMFAIVESASTGRPAPPERPPQ